MKVLLKRNVELSNVGQTMRVDEEGCRPSGVAAEEGHCVLEYIFYGRGHVCG